MDATTKQTDFILSLAGARFLSDVTQKTGVYLSQRERRGGLTKARASEVITELKSL